MDTLARDLANEILKVFIWFFDLLFPSDEIGIGVVLVIVAAIGSAIAVIKHRMR